MRRERPQPTIAVALHGIEPASFERCALIRDWLSDHGVERVTLLVVPARDLHPVGERSPEMVAWLCERREAGDEIGQHGLHHEPLRSGSAAGRLRGLAHGHRQGEFTGLGRDEARRAVEAGWRVLKLAGIEPDGFVAPAYAYTPALRDALSAHFRWWADLLHVHRAGVSPAGERDGALAPAWSLGAGGSLSRVLSPGLLRAGSILSSGALRLDLHPADLRRTRHMRALEWVLARNGTTRRAVTYGELIGGGDQPLGLAVNIAGSNDFTPGTLA